eukprot:4651825-Prymnesium_polylepis.1
MSCPSARSPSRTTESVSRRASYSCRLTPALLPTAAALPCAAIAYIFASSACTPRSAASTSRSA